MVGNFDDIKLENESVDFIIEFDSLHHSFNLDKTIRESARILKPGAKLLAIDRSHWSTSRKEGMNLRILFILKNFSLLVDWTKHSFNSCGKRRT